YSLDVGDGAPCGGSIRVLPTVHDQVSQSDPLPETLSFLLGQYAGVCGRLDEPHGPRRPFRMRDSELLDESLFEQSKGDNKRSVVVALLKELLRLRARSSKRDKTLTNC